MKRTILATLASTSLVLGLAFVAPTAQASRPDAVARTLSMNFIKKGTKTAVQGIKVTVTEVATKKSVSKTSDLSGSVSFTGLRGDEYAIRVVGSGRGYESGEITCGKPYNVVPSGCTHSATALGAVYIERG